MKFKKKIIDGYIREIQAALDNLDSLDLDLKDSDFKLCRNQLALFGQKILGGLKKEMKGGKKIPFRKLANYAAVLEVIEEGMKKFFKDYRKFLEIIEKGESP